MIADLTTVTVHRTSVSEMDNRCYVITSRETGAQVLVDAAADAPALRALLSEAAGAEPDLRTIVTTHRHWDHVRALAELAEDGVELLGGEADVTAIETEAGLDAGSVQPLEHGQAVEVEDIELQVIQLRGHTPGSVALALVDGGEVHLFTGDSLFPGGVGRTSGKEDFEQLLGDVRTQLFDAFDDAAHVHPGHGDPTTLGQERPHLDEWAERGW